MRFKLYMLMLEWPYHYPNHPLEIVDPKSGKFVFDAVDFRVEDWGTSGANLGADSGHKKALFDGRISFSAKLPNGSYLNVDIPEGIRASRYLKAESAAPANMYIGYDAPDYEDFVLPDYWYDYAAFFHGNDLVKLPRVMREEDRANLSRQEREGKIKPRFAFAGGGEVSGQVQPPTSRPTFKIAGELLK